MIEIKRNNGDVVKVFAETFENEAWEQVKKLANYSAYDNSTIRIMPDAHAGKGCTIGTTMTLHDMVTPNLVGVDIGCGMLVVDLGEIEIDFAKLDGVIKRFVPSGFDIHTQAWAKFDDLDELICMNSCDISRAIHSIGTLGGGNHFIEVDYSEKTGHKYLVIHTGSRHLGVEVCNYYKKIAESIEYHPELIIEQLKNSGQQRLISEALKQYRSTCKAKNYLSGESYENYLHDMLIAQRYAILNRHIIASMILSRLGLNAISEWETVHNYIDLESNILRKGAVSAKAGEKLLIPINMKEGSLICIGKGNKSWNYSAPHGAGRLMSRAQARNTLSVEEFKQSMSNIYSSTVCESTLDEAPMAYKPIEVITNDIKETVDVVTRIKPIYNYKATN